MRGRDGERGTIVEMVAAEAEDTLEALHWELQAAELAVAAAESGQWRWTDRATTRCRFRGDGTPQNDGMRDSLPFLERCALWMLQRSRRITLLIVKTDRSPEVDVMANLADPIAADLVSGLRKTDPPVARLERVYQQPACDRDG